VSRKPGQAGGAAAQPAPVTTRRVLLAGAGAAGAGALLAGCGGGGPAGGDDRADGVIAEIGEIEVGGGHINATERVVVTQPSVGDFRGFSAICTHMGCTVSSVRDGTINCACHGSRYSIEDGSVVQPAMGMTLDNQNPLPPVDVIEEDGTIVRA
jgi:nitrite reductase/ring-hydroxylating ferredoxin subunit